MRLLQLGAYPSFSLAEFSEDEVPRYAILSHTWGRDSDEVTYQDIIDGSGSSKAGYDKLHFCAVQAKSDGLGYCWIDTCCIDKKNAAELTESINSMFRWYQNAARCYVFLTDVSTFTSEDDRDSQLRNSRWFTRGWTLQELIAPQCVEFFSQKRERLGDRMSLEKQIHQITGISIHALRGEPLSHFSMDERMSWAQKRTTKRPEDKVYSLLGIFDIHMEAIYGEGEHHASRRLQRELERQSENHQLGELFRDRLQKSSARKPKVSPIKQTWIVPFERNSRFTSREPELARIEEMLFGEHRTSKLAITGLGGVGKTQLVIELLYRVADEQKDCSVIWIPAVNMESLHQSYLDVARKIGIPGFEDDEADVKRLVQEHLSKESTGRWLLVFDNADDIEMWIPKAGPRRPSGQEPHALIDYLPKSKQGAVVFTTRDRKIAVKLAQQNVVDVREMGEDAAAQLLEKCLVNGRDHLAQSPQETRALLLQLTYLPLAIVQAAAYINENAISLADYHSLLAEQEEEVIELLSEEFEDDGRYRDIKNPVATTWLISFDQIRQRDPLAADYLSFMACIEPKSIPQSLLPPGASRKKEVDAIGTLTAYSFVDKRPDDECLDIHRLVHLAIRNWLWKEELFEQSTEKVIVRLEEALSKAHQLNRTAWRKYLAHASYALGSDIGREYDEVKADLLEKLGRCQRWEGRWNEAECAFLRVVEIRTRIHGPEHPETLNGLSDLTVTHIALAQLDKAEKLGLQLLEIYRRVLGPEHPDTLGTMHHLAIVYSEKGQLDEAKKLGLQVLEICQKVLGLEHPDTLTSMNNLAAVYRGKGELDQAKKLMVQVLEIRQRVLGLEHPDTLISMNNLAAIYRGKGELDQAKKLIVQVLEIRQRVFTQEHPDTLTSISNLALVYRNTGQFKEAMDLGVQTLENRKRVLGPEHPDTLISINNLSFILMDMGEKAQALQLMEECVRLRKQVLGVDHPNFLRSSATLEKWRKEAEA